MSFVLEVCDISSKSATRGTWPWPSEKQQWRLIKCSLVTWWNHQEYPRKGKREIFHVYSMSIPCTVSSSSVKLFQWKKFKMGKVFTLSLCLRIKPLGCDDSLLLGQNRSFRWQNLSFVHWGTASTVRGTSQALDKHMMEESWSLTKES